MQQKPEDDEQTEYDEDGAVIRKKVTFQRKVE
jgi:hypothetical protein